MICFALLSYAMLCYAMLCYAMLCYAMLCYAMLCYVMLCYAMLCYAMLCYAMLCYAMLCNVIFSGCKGTTYLWEHRRFPWFPGKVQAKINSSAWCPSFEAFSLKLLVIFTSRWCLIVSGLFPPEQNLNHKLNRIYAAHWTKWLTSKIKRGRGGSIWWLAFPP